MRVAVVAGLQGPGWKGSKVVGKGPRLEVSNIGGFQGWRPFRRVPRLKGNGNH